MKDHLLDLVEHTHDLGVIDLVKITGTAAETTIFGIAAACKIPSQSAPSANNFIIIISFRQSFKFYNF